MYREVEDVDVAVEVLVSNEAEQVPSPLILEGLCLSLRVLSISLG